MERFDTRGLFTCPHCKCHHHVFRVTCPNCGRVLVRDFSEKFTTSEEYDSTDIYTGKFLIKAIAVLTLVWIAILLFFCLI